ncbi:MAG TPA: MBL fold metallo-hydrolase, partial [Candidatus Limnocylindria bacterium]|nr:MBL fold metallo-hydrolase [Candidatus Limnocylindria bacterium]
MNSHLRYLGHSTVLIQMDGVSILTDPLLVDRLGLLHRHTDAVAHLIEDVKIDVVLISHAHHDHLHLPSLRRCRGQPRIVVPRGLGKLASRAGHDVVEVSAGERFDVAGVGVEAIRAEHDGHRRPFGPAAEALGYRIAGSSRAYFAGDTDLFTEMAELAGKVDVALLPVWGWGPRLGTGHLDPARAAEAVLRIRPRIAIPIHWGTFYPFAFARLWPHPLGDPPRDFALEAARIAPE